MLDRHGAQAAWLTGADLHTVPAKRFLPEDQASAIAERVASLTART